MSLLSISYVWLCADKASFNITIVTTELPGMFESAAAKKT